MSPIDLAIAAMLWAAIPHIDREENVPEGLQCYVDWIYAQPPEMWAPLTGTGL